MDAAVFVALLQHLPVFPDPRRLSCLRVGKDSVQIDLLLPQQLLQDFL